MCGSRTCKHVPSFDIAHSGKEDLPGTTASGVAAAAYTADPYTADGDFFLATLLQM